MSDWAVDELDEQLGTKEKWWLQDRTWLFKQVRAGRDGPLGEDWAEKVVEQLGRRLGTPVAEVELAIRHGAPGIISRSVVPADARLEHGNELLVRVDPDYDRDQSRYNVRYTVAAVKAALEGVTAPTAAPELLAFNAFDVWTGYLVLDAWVGGRDRHHENWGAVSRGPSRELAPSFDHGNALGFQESDTARDRLARDSDALARWARRGKSHHFAGKPRLSDLANEALSLASDVARTHWREQLVGVGQDECQENVEQVPGTVMSAEARTFVLELLKTNQRRLIDGD